MSESKIRDNHGCVCVCVECASDKTFFSQKRKNISKNNFFLKAKHVSNRGNFDRTI